MSTVMYVMGIIVSMSKLIQGNMYTEYIVLQIIS